jgi:AcrR family transcriptional regulator
MTIPDHVTRKAGRPRSAQSHQAILKATIELLAEEGIGSMSIEAVAARAGVGKATIYRRWSSKENLVIDAIHGWRTEVPIIETGNLREDLIVALRNAFQAFSNNPFSEKLVFRLIGDAKSNPEIFQAFQAKLIAPRIQLFTQMIERAKARGELRQDTDPLIIVSLIFGSLTYPMLLAGTGSTSPPSTNLPEQIVDTVLHGIAHQ